MASISLSQTKTDLLSGLTVALALVPEAVAFSFVAGVAPTVGLYAAFFVGLIASLLGKPGMISGATGAMAVVMVSLVSVHGVEYLFAAVVLTGLLQLLAGGFRLGKLIRLVPHPVMLGFVNGLAIVIFLAQLEQFKVAGPNGEKTWMASTELGLMAALIGLTMAIIHFLPRFTKAVPSSLAAILAVSLLVGAVGLQTRTVGDVTSIAGSFPSFHIPMVPLTWETLQIIFPYSAILAAVGLIESLLTMSVIDEMTETKGRPNRECVAQGAANLATGFFGGMGGCAMIGQSMINISSGGRGRLSGATAAVSLLIFVVFASHLIELIPLAALVGVMFMVVIGTFEWSSLRILRKIPRSDAFVLVLVSAVTVFTDLAVAVLIGVLISAVNFAWKHSHMISRRVSPPSNGESEDQITYSIFGPLFFASTGQFLDLFDPESDPKTVVLDFSHSQIMDHSGLNALEVLRERYQRHGKTLRLAEVSQNCASIMERARNLVNMSYDSRGSK